MHILNLVRTKFSILTYTVWNEISAQYLFSPLFVPLFMRTKFSTRYTGTAVRTPHLELDPKQHVSDSK
jgi:hypothetical protein